MPGRYTKLNGQKNGKTMFKVDPNKFLFNVDTLWLNVAIDNYNEVMNKSLELQTSLEGTHTLLSFLDQGRTHSLDNHDPAFLRVDLKNYDSPLLFEVNPGQRPIYFASIRNDDIAIYFRKRQKETVDYAVKVQINQFILWEKGVEAAFQEAMSVLRQFGFKTLNAKINRIDFACHSDQFDWTLDDLKKFSFPQSAAGKTRLPDFFRLDPIEGTFETMIQGDRTRRQIRIYNKSIEIKEKKKYYFTELYEKHNMNPDAVWNIEIELRHDFISQLRRADEKGKERSIFDDFERCLKEGGLAELFTFAVKDFNHDSPFWRQYVKGDPSSKFYQTDGFSIIRDKQIDQNFDREVAQILGRLQLAVLKSNDKSLDHALHILKEKVEERGIDFSEKAVKKASKMHNDSINSTISASFEDDSIFSILKHKDKDQLKIEREQAKKKLLTPRQKKDLS